MNVIKILLFQKLERKDNRQFSLNRYYFERYKDKNI